jgi:hypothetical protein
MNPALLIARVWVGLLNETRRVQRALVRIRDPMSRGPTGSHEDSTLKLAEEGAERLSDTDVDRRVAGATCPQMIMMNY